MMAASTRPLGLSRGQRRFSSKELFGLACTSAQRPLGVCPWLTPGWKVVAIGFALISLAGFVPSSAEQSRSGLSLLPQKRKHSTLRTVSVPAPHYISGVDSQRTLPPAPEFLPYSSTSVRIAHEVLKATRIECLRTQSDYPGGPNQWCNQEGPKVLRSLAKQIRSRQ
jgi:hypothetical protein